MPRLVPLSNGPPPSPDSTYLERVAKYIPGEVVAAFNACFAIIRVQDDANPAKLVMGWVVFALLFAGTPVYLYVMNQQAKDPLRGRPLAIQLSIATLSFVAWSYALGGPFALAKQPEVLGGYQEWIGAIFLILYTSAVGLYKPSQQGETRQKESG
jgi:hypothetical protein